jgi:hypothetical protein
MAKYLRLTLVALPFACGALLATWHSVGQTMSNAALVTHVPRPSSIVICGIRDRPCITYTVSYHQSTQAFGDRPGSGFTDYEAKTIAIASSNDPVTNVQALTHEVYHAALWERGFMGTRLQGRGQVAPAFLDIFVRRSVLHGTSRQSRIHALHSTRLLARRELARGFNIGNGLALTSSRFRKPRVKSNTSAQTVENDRCHGMAFMAS